MYIFIGFLFMSAVFDIRNRKIPSVLIWSFFVIMTGYRIVMIVRGMTSFAEIIGLLLPGILLLILSRISNEIGNGDGLLVIATGCYLGGIRNIGMVFLAFLLAAFTAIALLIGARSMRNKKIAFAPFLLAASLIVISV